MLRNRDVIATIAVRKIDVARKFYEDTLGLKPGASEESGVLVYQSGNSSVLVYESEYAGTNRATAATWQAGDDVDAIVRSLKTKGVVFEKYDFPGMTREGDVHVAGKMRAAWFKDPDGNILAIVSGST